MKEEKELWQMVLDKLDDVPYYDKVAKKRLHHAGLCTVVDDLFREEYITISEKNYMLGAIADYAQTLKRKLFTHGSSRYYYQEFMNVPLGYFVWKPYDKKVRVKWLNKLINKQ